MEFEKNYIFMLSTILRLLGETNESDMEDSSDTEEEREKKRKLQDSSKDKSTKTSEESIFLKKIIDVIRKSEGKIENY